MVTYDDYLAGIDIIDKDTFEGIVESLPEIDPNEVDWDGIDSYYDEEDLCRELISAVLKEHTKYAYVDSVNLCSRTMTLLDIADLAELEKVKEIFKNWWEITNYEELEEDLIEEEKEEEASRKRNEVMYKLNKLPTEVLEEILEKYEQK